MKKAGIIFLPVVFVLSTCTKYVDAPSACFQENILPIFVSNCTMSGCHNSHDKRRDLDLSTYEGIMKGVKAKHPLLSDVYKSIKGNSPEMPPREYKALSSKEVNLIKLWINAGARNTSNCTACDSSTFTYNARIQPLMNTWCVGCHSSSNKNGNVDLSNYEGVAVTAANGRLLGSIRHDQGFVAMPQNGGSLSSCDVAAITKWVSKGYANN
jgi:hypothetical protein